MKVLSVFLKLTLISMLLMSHLHAEMTSAKSIKAVEIKVVDLLKTHKHDQILVAFDIDMTLTQPDHPALYYPALRKYRDIYKRILGNVSPERKDWISTWTTLNLPQRLVEQETPQVIIALQEKGVRTMAFTASLSGSLKEEFPKAIILKYENLLKKGLNFTTNFPELEREITFSEFKQYAHSYPMFYKGILSANGEKNTSKGTVFCAFLKALDYQPEVILLVDDKKKHLEDMKEKLKICAPSSKFIGIEYQGAFDYAPHDISSEDFEKFWMQRIESDS